MFDNLLDKERQMGLAMILANYVKLLTLIIMVFLLASCNNQKKEDTQAPEGKSVAKKENVEKLEKRINELGELNSKLTNKKSEINNLREKFTGEIKDYKQEINLARQSDNVQSFEGTLSNYRIKNNLVLIQHRLAYMVKLEQIESGLMRGTEEVFFLKRKFEGDLDVIKVLDEKELANLVVQIDLVLEKYLPYADKLVIDMEGIDVKSSKQIWEDILNEEKAKREAEEKVRRQQELVAEKIKKEQELAAEKQRQMEAREAEQQHQIEQEWPVKDQNSSGNKLYALLKNNQFSYDLWDHAKKKLDIDGKASHLYPPKQFTFFGSGLIFLNELAVDCVQFFCWNQELPCCTTINPYKLFLTKQNEEKKYFPKLAFNKYGKLLGNFVEIKPNERKCDPIFLIYQELAHLENQKNLVVIYGYNP